MLPKDQAQRRRAYEIVRAVTTATGEPTPEALARLKALALVFGVDLDEPEISPAIVAVTGTAEMSHAVRNPRREKLGKG